MLTPTYFTDYEQYKWLFQLTNISLIIVEILSVGLIAFLYVGATPKFWDYLTMISVCLLLGCQPYGGW